MTKNKFFVALTITTLLFSPFWVLAASVELGGGYSLKEEESSVSNLYVITDKAAVAGKVFGDLTVVASQADVSGNITGDTLIVAGKAVFSGQSGGDLRVAAGRVTISGVVKGDLVVLSGSAILQSGALVEGDLIAAGGNIYLSGDISHDAKIWSDSAFVESKISGSIDFVGSELTIKKGALVSGGVIYTVSKESDLILEDAASVKGALEYKDREIGANFKSVWNTMTGRGTTFLFFLASLLFVSVITALISGKMGQAIATDMSLKFGWRLLTGLLFLIVTPIAAVLLAISLIGFFAGLVLSAFSFFWLFVSGAFASIGAGEIINRAMKSADGTFPLKSLWLKAVVGSVVLSAISLAPVVGQFICLIVIIAAGGSIIFFVRSLSRNFGVA